MAALRALHPDRKARGYSQKWRESATRKCRLEQRYSLQQLLGHYWRPKPHCFSCRPKRASARPKNIFSPVMPAHSRSKNGVLSPAYVAGIHVLAALHDKKSWTAGTSPAMSPVGRDCCPSPLVPAKAGTQCRIPACAGMSGVCRALATSLSDSIVKQPTLRHPYSLSRPREGPSSVPPRICEGMERRMAQPAVQRLTRR